MCHFTETNTAQAELAIDRMRTTALVATRVAANLELRLCLLLIDECFLRHGSGLLERESEKAKQGAAFIIGLRSGDKGDVHATGAIDLVLVNLVEH